MRDTVARSDAGAAPTVHDVRTGLEQSLGLKGGEAVWSSLCAALGVRTDVASLEPDRFEELLTLLSRHDRLCHVLAMSWRIRATAARKLADIGR